MNSPSLHTLRYVPRPLLTYAGPKSCPTTICQPPEEEVDVAPLAQASQSSPTPTTAPEPATLMLSKQPKPRDHPLIDLQVAITTPSKAGISDEALHENRGVPVRRREGRTEVDKSNHFHAPCLVRSPYTNPTTQPPRLPHTDEQAKPCT